MATGITRDQRTAHPGMGIPPIMDVEAAAVLGAAYRLQADWVEVGLSPRGMLHVGSCEVSARAEHKRTVARRGEASAVPTLSLSVEQGLLPLHDLPIGCCSWHWASCRWMAAWMVALLLPPLRA